MVFSFKFYHISENIYMFFIYFTMISIHFTEISTFPVVSIYFTIVSIYFTVVSIYFTVVFIYFTVISNYFNKYRHSNVDFEQLQNSMHNECTLRMIFVYFWRHKKKAKRYLFVFSLMQFKGIKPCVDTRRVFISKCSLKRCPSAKNNL